MMVQLRLLTVAVLSLPGASCTTPVGLEALSATAWTQTAAEREAICLQTFGTALAAVRDRMRSANRPLRPPAVVLDIDETVLDNSPYQVGNIIAGRAFAPDTWTSWVSAGRAGAIPGSLEFTLACKDLGVVPIYITNRTREEEVATRSNLQVHGFPLHGDFDCVLTKGEVDMGSDKSGRRAHVETTHQVLAWIGDDLGDFLTPAPTPESRMQQVRDHRDRWGATWFVLPNPMYGSWERALVEKAGCPSPSALRQALRP